ncbi:MAG: GDSL-type esterase/lipase family protein [Huintestinicola sp.]
MNRKIIPAVLAVMICMSLAACGAKDNSESPPAAESAEGTTAPPAETKVSITTTAAPTEPFDLEAEITDTMYSRALMNEGNKSRLAAAMKKAESGENITVGVIGGSITQGTAASSSELCYAGLFNNYWVEKFPQAQVDFINAGIGGTNSYLGVSRVDRMLLDAKPDVVIVEFSVNDTDKVMNKYSYDSLVRKILNCESNPAVIMLITTQDNGTSLQDTHKEIGFAYDLPILSYHDLVYPEVAAGTLDWKDISPDNIHPNDKGHEIIGQIITRYLDSVYAELDSIDTNDQAFTAEPYTADYYKDAALYAPSDITIGEMTGFEVGTNGTYPQLFPENWVTEGEGSMKFEADFRTFGVFYLKTTNGKGGKYDVFIDGERKGTIDADFSGGWGNYGETKSIFLSKEVEHHEVEIRLSEGSANTEMTILSFMMS